MPRASLEAPQSARAVFKAHSTLRTCALITTSVLILNKVPSLYALASVITKGSPMESAMQITMHTYSLLALIIAACLLPIIRRQASPRTSESRPMALVLLAHLHVIDFILGVVFTILFATTWFRMIAHPDPSKAGPGAADMDAAAGFTTPENPVESVALDAVPAEGTLDPSATNHTLAGLSGSGDAAGNVTAIGDGSQFGPEGAANIFLMSALWAIRTYLLGCIIIYVNAVIRDAQDRGSDVTEKHGWLDTPGRWLYRLEERFWAGGNGYQPLKRNRRHSGPSPRRSVESDKEWN